MKALTALCAASILISSPVLASPELAKKNGCVVCHDMKAKKVGPTWPEIAAKTAGDVTAIKTAIEKGSKGKYGKIPMPPQPKAKGDAEALASWIAGLK